MTTADKAGVVAAVALALYLWAAGAGYSLAVMLGTVLAIRGVQLLRHR